MVLAVGVLGSPRVGGNSDRLLAAALLGAGEAGAEVRRVALRELDLSPCDSCWRCEPEGRCVVEDDMQRLYGLFTDLDVLVIASPIYFSGLTAQVKAMIDRCHCLWLRKRRQGAGPGSAGFRRGAFLSVGADARPRFDLAIAQIKPLFKTLDVEYAGQVTVPGVEGMGDIEAHPGALEEARQLGARLVQGPDRQGG